MLVWMMNNVLKFPLVAEILSFICNSECPRIPEPLTVPAIVQTRQHSRVTGWDTDVTDIS